MSTLMSLKLSDQGGRSGDSEPAASERNRSSIAEDDSPLDLHPVTGDDAVGPAAAAWRGRITEQQPVGAGLLGGGGAGVALALLVGSEPSGAGWDRFLLVPGRP